MRRIETEADLAEGLAFLIAADPRLERIAEVAGPLPLRRRSGGFEGLAAVVTSQQISIRAAASIWERLERLVDPFTPERLLAKSETELQSVGLSRPKIRCLTAIGTALVDGFDLDGVAHLPATEAVAALVSLKGVGPWTAESYLLFCIGHVDTFPAGDLALQIAVGDGLGLDARPNEKALRRIAEAWSPWRGVAARLFWAYYAARRRAASDRRTSLKRPVATGNVKPGLR